MMGRTHALIGINALWLFTLLPAGSISNWGMLAAVATLGSLLPDLDAAESTLKHWSVCQIKPFAPIAVLLHHRLGHRRLLHSLRGLASQIIFCAMLAGMIGVDLALALLLGYASHLAADACTRAGIRLFYSRPGCSHLLPQQFRISTGSSMEEAVFGVSACLALALLLEQLP